MSDYIRIILWIDDVRDPKDFIKVKDNERVIWCKSVNEAIKAYSLWGSDLNDRDVRLVEINIDHDAGDYAKDGGDFIKFLDWMEMIHPEDFTKLTWHIISMNPVGVYNMLTIFRRNGVPYV